MAHNLHVVDFWHCLGCDKPYRVLRPTYQMMEPYLPILSTDTKAPILLCEACGDLRSYSKNDLPLPRTFDTETKVRFVFVQKIFLGRIVCAEKSCASPIEILLPRTKHWDLPAVQGLNPVDWRIHPNVLCSAKHPPALPITWSKLEEIKH